MSRQKPRQLLNQAGYSYGLRALRPWAGRSTDAHLHAFFLCRLIVLLRLLLLATAALHGIQLHYDVSGWSGGEYRSLLLLPLPILRPLFGLLLTFLAYFANSHYIFRWICMLTQPVALVLAAMTSAQLQSTLGCRAAGTCLRSPGAFSFPDATLVLLQQVQLAGVVAAVWLLLTGAYLTMIMGPCYSRYPVKLFKLSLWGVLSGKAGSRGRGSRGSASEDKAAAGAMVLGHATAGVGGITQLEGMDASPQERRARRGAKLARRCCGVCCCGLVGPQDVATFLIILCCGSA